MIIVRENSEVVIKFTQIYGKQVTEKNIFDGRATLCGLENQLRGEKMSVLDDTGSCHMFFP